MLHDIGKLVLPDAVLTKRGPLTDDERALMQTHPREGWRMLAARILAIADAFLGLDRDRIAAYTAAARSVASKSVRGTGPTHGEVVPAVA